MFQLSNFLLHGCLHTQFSELVSKLYTCHHPFCWLQHRLVFLLCFGPSQDAPRYVQLLCFGSATNTEEFATKHARSIIGSSFLFFSMICNSGILPNVSPRFCCFAFLGIFHREKKSEDTAPFRNPLLRRKKLPCATRCTISFSTSRLQTRRTRVPLSHRHFYNMQRLWILSSASRLGETRHF